MMDGMARAPSPLLRHSGARLGSVQKPQGGVFSLTWHVPWLVMRLTRADRVGRKDRMQVRDRDGRGSPGWGGGHGKRHMGKDSRERKIEKEVGTDGQTQTSN